MMNILGKLFNERYYKTKQFEQDGKIYKYMGIHIYKKIIMCQVKNKKVNNYNLMTYSINGIKNFERESRYNEKVHMIIAIPMLLLMLFMCFFTKDILDVLKTISILLLNIFVNIYPICLQRYNRIRINRILNRFKFDK